MGGRTFTLVVAAAAMALGAVVPDAASAASVRVTRVGMRVGGVPVTTLPRTTPLTFVVRYRIARLSARAHRRARVRITFRHQTSQLTISTRRSAAYAETGSYVWSVHGPGVLIDARFPAGIYRMSTRVELLRADGSIATFDLLARDVVVV